MYFWLFPWQPTVCSILPLFLYWGGGVIQEVDVISMVRPYASSVTHTAKKVIPEINDIIQSVIWEGKKLTISLKILIRLIQNIEHKTMPLWN